MQTAEMKIRLPQDLRNWLETRSTRNFRPMNSEVVALLTAIREGEEQCSGLDRFTIPSGTSGTV